MSSFTEEIIITAVRRPVRGWFGAVLPPSFQRPVWKVYNGFTYAIGDLENPDQIIIVAGGFRFDGASVPWVFRFLVPMAHPNYIQATALHDWMLEGGEHPRKYCDDVFYEALGVLGMPALWRSLMYRAVRMGSLIAYMKGMFRWNLK